jgi:hypothetical protein
MEERQEIPEIQESNSTGNARGPRIISYNLREEERPGGMKVRFKVRVEAGRKAAVLDERQAEAIRELLQWVRQHRNPGPGESPDGTPPPQGR